jgi:hypothetical protein
MVAQALARPADVQLSDIRQTYKRHSRLIELDRFGGNLHRGQDWSGLY